MTGTYCGGRSVVFPQNQLDIDPTYIVDLTESLERIEYLAHHFGCKSVVVDSLSGSHFIDEISDKMRQVLMGLAQLAGTLQVPVILVHHPRKQSFKEAAKMTLDRVRGSSTITQFCRSVIGMYRIVENPSTPVRVKTIKSTFCAPPEPFGFIIGNDGLTFCEAPEEPRSRTALDYAVEFLQRELTKKPMKFKILRQLAEEEGITKNTPYRGKKHIGIISERGVWRLASVDESLKSLANQIL